MWAIKLSVDLLLTGRVMDVYTRMSHGDANESDKLKKALLTRYNHQRCPQKEIQGGLLQAILGLVSVLGLRK